VRLGSQGIDLTVHGGGPQESRGHQERCRGGDILKVLSVPHRYRAESVGTAQIPIGIRLEILEHSTTQIVGNLSNLSDRIPIGKVNSDRTTRNYF